MLVAVGLPLLAGLAIGLLVLAAGSLLRERRIDARLRTIRERGIPRPEERSDILTGLLEASAIFSPVARNASEIAKVKDQLIRAGFEEDRALLLYRAILAVSFAALPGGTLLLLLTRAEPVGLPIWMVALPLSAFAALRLPPLWLDARARARTESISEALPELIDLMVICIEGGQSFDAAMRRSAEELRRTQPALAGELERVNLAIRAGGSRTDALRQLAERTGIEDVRDLTTMLIQADRSGVALRDSLQTHAETMRALRLQRAEERAAKLPVKLMAPLAVCLLPALMMILFGPAVLQLAKVFGSP